MNLQAIVLAGGLGTRLRAALGDTPKVMAPVGGRPFLEHVLVDLDQHGFRRVVLAVGYKKEVVAGYFGSSFRSLSLAYSEERALLGTGGAVRLALGLADHGPCFVLNGDSWVEVNYKEMLRVHVECNTHLSMAVHQVPDVSRFGAVEVEDGHIARFCEKGRKGPGYINAGIYLLDRDLFSIYTLPETFSLELDFFAPNLPSLSPLAFPIEGCFIDIGVPEDYQRAQEMFESREI